MGSIDGGARFLPFAGGPPLFLFSLGGARELLSVLSPTTGATGDFSGGASDGVADGFGGTLVGKRESLSDERRRMMILVPFGDLVIGLVADAVVDMVVDGEGISLEGSMKGGDLEVLLTARSLGVYCDRVSPTPARRPKCAFSSLCRGLSVVINS